MAATLEEFWAAEDIVEGSRTMDGNILRSETYSSASLSTQLTITYEDSGKPVSEVLEDI
jgi:hypothetical protein